MEKLKAQISFGKDEDLKEVKLKLKSIDTNKYDLYCCFLPEHIVRKHNFDTDIIDVLNKLDNLTWVLGKYETLNEALENIDAEREALSKNIDKLFIISSSINKGLAKEIEMFSNNKIKIL